jgi:1,2-diacylglycerol 3-beta-glucosyltransferase
MPNHPWNQDNVQDDAYNELEPISTFTSDLDETEDINAHFYRGLAGRRRKAAVAITVVWSSTIALHLVSWGTWFVAAVTTIMGIHALRLLWARPFRLSPPLATDDPEQVPFVSLLVAAKNEEAVVTSLVRTLCSLDYPENRYELWVIDDNSSDRTPQILDQLVNDYPQLRVVHRAGDATGGKSGALNQVLSLTQGDIIGVFDADARVPEDLLLRVLPLFERKAVGAVQVQKAIFQSIDPGHPAADNLWVQGQTAEMALDCYFQQQRIAVGGLGELRGNGQFVRRAALENCGGWNEETITDDLDLTFRLHLDRWDIEFLLFPAVQEEGVTRALSLWHQRNRWAEGGYQRYLDYWRLVVRNRMGTRKTVDLLMFWVTQYLMPTAAVPDLMMAIARNTTPVFAPITGLTITLSVVGMFVGLRRIRSGYGLQRQTSHSLLVNLATLGQALRGTLYMLHWFPIMASTTARISVRPKRLKWVKTIHQGSDDVWIDVTEQP